MRITTAVVAAGVGLVVLFTALPPAGAQTRPAPALDVSAGWVGFPDDGSLVSELLGGAAARYYVSRRLAVGPELVFIQGDSHLMLTGNLSVDLRRSGFGRSKKATPFLVLGGGLYQTRETLLRGGPYTSREGAFTMGGGVRAPVGERGTVGVEARIGWEAHLRLNAVFGWRLGSAP